MANLYRVIYVTEPEGMQISVPVQATTTQNAIAAAQAADSTFNTVVSVETMEENILIGS